MTVHITTTRLNRFRVRALPVAELSSIAEHLDVCTECTQQFTVMLQSARAAESLKITLAPELETRHEHVDYDQLVRLAHKTMDASEREMLDLHLQVCGSCVEDIRSFLAIQEQLGSEIKASLIQQSARERSRSTQISWWGNLDWKPAYAVATLLVGFALVLVAVFLRNRGAANQQFRHAPTPSTDRGAISANRATNGSLSPVRPSESPTVIPNSAEAAVSLIDRTGRIAVDKNGNVTGLDNVPAATRDQVAKVLLTERLERSAILESLMEKETGLRGANNAAPFRLLAPSKVVIITDQPTLKWEKVPAAKSYRVYLSDVSGHALNKSEELLSDTTEWKVTKAIMRGKIYVWTVVAVIDGKEVVSPGPAAPDMKFYVLSLKDLKQWKKLKKTRSHLALGVFYAKAGLTTDAHRELKELVRLNPKSNVARTLLRTVSH
jgi:hypothetical protein